MTDPIWIGNEALRPFLVAVESVTHHPRNARTHNLPAISDSLVHFGQQVPVIVQRSSGFIVKGNGTTRAARELVGWTHIAVVPTEMDDETALRFLAADNRSSDLGDYDYALLGDLLTELAATPTGLAGTGYAAADLDVLLADLAEIGRVGTPQPRLDLLGSRTEGGQEVTLVYTEESAVDFARFCAMIQREKATSDLPTTVLTGLRLAAQAL